MKKYLLLLLFLIPLKADAYYCEFSNLSRLKKEASNITTSYDYVENGNNVTFNITISNLTSDLYIINTANNQIYNYTGNDIVINNYASNQKIRFEVRTNYSFCNEEVIGIFYVNLPPYNPYYKDAVCQNYNYELCQKWYYHNYNYEQFVKKVNDSKITIKPPIIDDEKIEDKSIYEIIIQFLINYYYLVLGGIILISGTIIIINNRKNKVDF